MLIFVGSDDTAGVLSVSLIFILFPPLTETDSFNFFMLVVLFNSDVAVGSIRTVGKALS